MARQIVDDRGVEKALEAFGDPVWGLWTESVRPALLDDPTSSNSDLEFDETFDDQVWIPGRDVAVTFEADPHYVYLIDTVDISDED